MQQDEQFAAFVDAYPAARRQRGYMAQTLFLAALEQVPYETLMAALAQHRRSSQWIEGRMIPNLITWLQEEHWIRVLPEPEAPLSRLTPYQQAKRLGLK